MKKSQLDFIRNKLEKTGKISRNLCLRNYISRLSAYILELRNEGMDITGGYKITKKGRDYIYTLNK